MIRIFIFIAVWLLGLNFELCAQSQPKIHKLVLKNFEKSNYTDCIVLLKSQPDLSDSKSLSLKTEKGRFVYSKLAENAAKTQVSVINILKSKNLSFQSFVVVNAIRIIADKNTLLEIEALKEVASILPNIPIRSDFPVKRNENAISKTNSLAEWGINMTLADKLWELGIKGAGVTVGGQDTGYDWSHPAIHSQYRGTNNGTANHNYHWHDAIHEKHPLNGDTLNPCGFNAQQPCDDNSHGTHTVGTMVGYDGADNFIGLAPEAKWIGCRNMERGWGLPSTYIECFEWFLAPTDLSNGNPNPDLAPHVINNSWSCPTEEGCEPANFEAMRIAVSNLKMSGVVVVVSAGNSGPSCSSINTPSAIFEESFVVGATNFLDSMANFSSRGPVWVDSSGRMKPNVVAPGVTVRSCIPNGGYANYSGTSMAGPHVAGAVALLISAAPELAGKVELIEEILEQSAKPLYPSQSCGNLPVQTQPNHVEGWGRIDLWKALAFVRPDLFNHPEKTETQIRAFPNPTSGEFVLISPVDIGSGRLLVSNYLGQKVLEKNVEFTRIHQFDFGDLPNGMYIITVFPESCPKEKYSVQLLKRN